MKKGLIKILEKAEKLHFSDKRLKYLKNEDFPLWYTENVFRIMNRFTDEEIGDYSFFDCLLKFGKEINEKSGNGFADIGHHIMWYKYKIPDGKLDAIKKVINGTDFKKYDMFCLICAGISYDETLKTIEVADSLNEKYRSTYKYLMEYYSYDYKTRKLNNYNFNLKSEYIKHIAVQNNLEVSYATVSFYLKRNLPLSQFIEDKYDAGNYINNMYKKNVPALYKIFGDFKNSISKSYYENEDEIEKIMELVKTFPEEHVINYDSTAVKVGITKSAEAITINLQKFSGINIYKKDNGEIHFEINWEKKSSNMELLFFYDGGFYKKYNGKFLPLSFKDLVKMKVTYFMAFKELIFPVIKELMLKYGNLILDFEKYLDKQIFFPITLNECKDVKNLNELFQNKYKEGYRINWNKTDLNLGYLIIKSLTWINPNKINKLVGEKDTNFLNKITGYRLNNIIQSFLTEYILKNINKDTYWKTEDGIAFSDDVRRIISDYIQMSREIKRKIHIGFSSAKKIKAEHDKIVKEYNLKSMVLVKVPSKSKFKELRNILPKEFEWIRTKTRLKEEADIMHHCVYGYAKKINKDNCAIYSFIYNNTGKRYTIEFMKNIKNERYRIEQIQGMCDRGCPREVRKYVQNFIA